jgi:hypothetical protein
MTRTGIVAALVGVLVGSGDASASPAACQRGPKDMVKAAKVIVEAKPVKSTVTKNGGRKFHRGEYTVVTTIRGEAAKTVVVEASCEDKPVPKSVVGYPGAQDYCRDGIGLELPGFTADKPKATKKQPIVLFLSAAAASTSDQKSVFAPVSTTGFGGCSGGIGRVVKPGEKAEAEVDMYKRLAAEADAEAAASTKTPAPAKPTPPPTKP